MRLRLPSHSLAEGSDKSRPGAFLPASVLIMQVDNPQRGLIPLNIPINAQAGKTPQAGDLVDAHFAIDLYEEVEPRLEPGEYVTYLVVQEYLSDPVKFSIESR